MSVAIMQPYVFPYIGYFQLLDAVDSFVFYDDVSFIKRGWINRNSILINGQRHLFSIPCSRPNYNVPINKVSVDYNTFDSQKFLQTIRHGYSKAIFFEPIYALLEDFLNIKYSSIGEMASQSIIAVSSFLGLNKSYYSSARDFPDIKGFNKADRLINITKALNQQRYVNASGGRELYSKDYFHRNGIDLIFVEPRFVSYSQLTNNFIPGLSIIDCLMNCSREVVVELVNNRNLVDIGECKHDN